MFVCSCLKTDRCERVGARGGGAAREEERSSSNLHAAAEPNVAPDPAQTSGPELKQELVVELTQPPGRPTGTVSIKNRRVFSSFPRRLGRARQVQLPEAEDTRGARKCLRMCVRGTCRFVRACVHVCVRVCACMCGWCACVRAWGCRSVQACVCGWVCACRARTRGEGPCIFEGCAPDDTEKRSPFEETVSSHHRFGF